MSSQRILCIRVLWGNVNLLVWGSYSRELLMDFNRTDDKKTTQSFDVDSSLDLSYYINPN